MTRECSLKRCGWVQLNNELSRAYHDEEWGLPVHDDRKLFEFLILEGAQAGLSWQTVLNRRKNYHQAFSEFDPQKIVAYTEKQVEKLLANEGIIRNKLKIASTISNAKHFLEVQEEFGSFDRYVWQFVGYKPIQNRWESLSEVPLETPESKALSKDLKKRGFKFVGSTIMYAYMQAVGLVNDHTIDCFRHTQVNLQ